MKRPPRPLTSTPAPTLDFSRSTGPVATDFDDIYYSVENGLEESRNVYLAACGMPDIWRGRETFTVAELGFGSGLNFLALWQMWQTHRPSPTARLNVISVEAFPFTKAELGLALAPWPEISELTKALIAKWPGRVKGRHILEFPDGVTLTLCHDRADAALSGLGFEADSWFLDGFSPLKNPDMWSPALMQMVFDHSAFGARIGTFTVAGDVVRALKAAGFETQKYEGFGKKRHRLEAVKHGISIKIPPIDPPIIIGIGIAGASLARSLLRRGITPILIDPKRDDGASGNPIAIVKPRLDLQDRPESRFFLSAYLFACNLYQGDHLHAEGAGQIARSEADALRFDKLAEQSSLPNDHMRRVYSDEFFDLTGLQSERGGLWFGTAPIIRPRSLIAKWTQSARHIEDQAADIRDNAVYNASGDKIAQGRTIIIAAGAGAIKLVPELPLSAIRGQIDWGGSDARLNSAISYGGYAAPYDGGVLVGATHSREDDGIDIRIADTRHNTEGFNAITGATVSPSFSRASVRVGAADGMPIAKTLSPGVHIITSLAGRGFSHAPLLAENMVRRICEETFSQW